MNRFIPLTGLALLTASAVVTSAGPFDWPQWQGSDRNAKSTETGLLQEWPKDGLPVAWKITELGGGYSAPAIASGRIFGMSNRGEDEVVWALSEKDGSEIWAKRLGSVSTGGMRQGIEGAGCTPTVDGERLYVLGHGGDLACFKVEDGEIVWRRSLTKDFEGKLPTWRYNESPLIDGNRVIVTPGGDDATLVALNKLTGEVIWKSKATDEASANAGSTGEADGPSGAGRGRPGGGRERPAGGRTQETEAPAEPATKPVALVAAGSKWKYSDTGAPAADWPKSEFNDDTWSEGVAQLGYGDRDEKTAISDLKDNYPTYYFRQKFEVKDPSSLKPLVLRILRDDGAVVYLNGSEVVRDNMPAGPVEHGTFASSTTPSENGYFVHDLAPDHLVAGTNLIAIEVHQADADSSDVSFDLELREKIPGDRVGPPPADRRSGGGGFGRGGFGNSGAAYSSAIAIDFGGKRQYVQFTSKALVGVAADDGKLLWRYEKPSNRSGINCSTPIYHDGHIFAASAYGAGGGLAKLSKDGETGIKAEEVWFSPDMENHHGGMLIVDDCLYGANGGNGGGNLVCIDIKSGEVLWNDRDKARDERRAPKGSVAFADGRIYYRTEDGAVILIEPNRKEYLERGRFEQPDRTRKPAWTHPVIANGKLYVRDQDLLLCYDVKG
ncbi:MAG: alcohol dehydrogenase (cytochrome c) [Verrucomicrobiales bacterium]|jgi:alcohol dehydrogenase (cytochrome c)